MNVRMLALLGRWLLNDWHAKARVLFTGLVLWQFAVWFDEYWLPATEWLVRAAIVTVAVTEWFTRIPVFWRRLVAIMLLLGLHAYRLQIGLEGVVANEGPQVFVDTLAAGLGEAALKLHPFAWFALGTTAIHWLLAGWLTERPRIAFMTIAGVILFALVDSYSKLILWQQAAVVVFAGLGLLVADHFDKFRRKHPASWSYLQEYPGTVVIPTVIVLSLVMLAGYLAPNARPLLTDPYTLYKHWKGEQVITGGKGFATGVLPEKSFRSGESGYSRDDGRLGDGFAYDYAEVMHITTNHPSYWRGETKSFYTGQGWEDHPAELDEPVTMVFSGQPLPGYDWEEQPPAGKTVSVRQRVTVFGERPDYAVLFGAPGMKAVRIGAEQPSPDPAGDSSGNGEAGVQVEGFWSARQGELYWMGTEYPRVYGVESEVPVADEDGWRSVTAEDFAALFAADENLWATYLQLPETLPERVRLLAEEVTADAGTPYDRAKQIEQYLKSNYPYSNLPDLSKGQSGDFVDRFLFEIREGYCDYFSTAMVVMARSVGLPARWVKGFKTGVHELELRMQSGMYPDQAILNQLRHQEGTYIVRNADAHSWVEVYFPGYGWLPFEPTSGFSLPLFEEAQEERETAALPAGPDEAATGGGSAAGILARSVAGVVAAGVLGLILLFGLLHPRGGRAIMAKVRQYRQRRRAARSWNEAALAEAGRILKMLRRKGFPRADHETLREAVQRWTGANRWLKPELDRLLGIVERARYSPVGVTEDEVAALQLVRRRLKEELK